MTSSTPIIPSYRGLTIAGNVLEKDEQGEVHHALVTDTTRPDEVVVVYVLRKAILSH
ncbi:MAG: hypothetical protein IPF41_12035 [Flavobacteriales bacterium]|nr:hypothetical protein [Flavobacteriales bacterium]